MQKQTNIFDYIDETDDLLVSIENLAYGQKIEIGEVVIVRYKFFEVLHESFHEMFHTAKGAYSFVME
ncbi:hypothetical protein AB0X56_06940 [Weissella paramesenteroides]|uniref:hypothetical protein n=1 Tax=Weissella paramesenteroides TaxID=1249 RepID=UPI003F229895